jgi:hypothetical protein
VTEATPTPPPTWLSGLGAAVNLLMALAAGYAVAIALSNWHRIGV